MVFSIRGEDNGLKNFQTQWRTRANFPFHQIPEGLAEWKMVVRIRQGHAVAIRGT
jgi:hypothetical protein